jgi:hypothetical protein
MRRRLFLIAILTFVAAPAFADWEQAFREGVRLYERKDFPHAAGYFKSAIEQKPTADGAKVNINGGFNELYTPYEYLAASFALMGNCEEAANALRSAQGPTKNTDKIRTAESKCGKMQTGPTQAELDAQKKADDAKKAEAARIAEENRKKAEDARVADENRKKAEDARIADENRKKAEDAKNAEATRIAAEEKRKAEADNAAKALAEETRKLEEQRKAADAKKAEDARKAEEARKAAEAKKLADDLADQKKLFNTLVGRSKSLLAQSTDAGPAREALTSAVNAAASLNATTVNEINTAHASLTRLYDEYLKVVTSGSSEKAATINFKAAIEAYMGGHYDQTIALLSKANYTGILKAQASLFTAASKFAASQLKGDSSPTTIFAIASDLNEFRRLEPDGQLDARIFSPAFREFAKASAH